MREQDNYTITYLPSTNYTKYEIQELLFTQREIPTAKSVYVYAVPDRTWNVDVVSIFVFGGFATYRGSTV